MDRTTDEWSNIARGETAERLRVLVRARVKASGISQNTIARELHCNPGYLSEALTGNGGRSPIGVKFAAQVLYAIGHRLTFDTEPL